MATTRVTHQQATAAGLTPVFTACDLVNGNNYLPNADRVLLFQNAGGSPVTVAIPTPGAAPGGLAIADVTVTVPANGLQIVSIQPAQFAEFVDGNGQIAFTASAALNVAVIQA
jgi:hypothetical protein